jgi:hypothetical protein
MEEPGTTCGMSRPGTRCGGSGDTPPPVTLTFSDGLTLASTNVTNDLVTGAVVAHVNAQTTSTSQFRIRDDGSILLEVKALTARLEFDALGEGTLESAAGKDLHLAAGALAELTGGAGVRAVATAGHLVLGATVGNVLVDAPAGRVDMTPATAFTLNTDGVAWDVTNTIHFTAGVFDVDAAGVTIDALTGNNIAITAESPGAGQINLTCAGSGTMTLQTASGDLSILSGRDELHTVGRNFSLVAQGSGGASIGTEIGNLTLDAATSDHTGEVRIQPRGSSPAAGETFRIWDGAGASQVNGATLLPSGGSVVDTELRAVHQLLVEALYAWGWVSNPEP